MLVSARRLNELGVVDAELATPAPVEETTRALSAPEFVASGQIEPAQIEPAGNGAAPIEPAGNGTAEPGQRVSLVRAAR